MLKQVEGIVLKTQNYGETHKILTLFTKDFGVISGISRGANKPKSKLVAVSQSFIKVNFLMYVNKGLSTIQQGEVLDAYRFIREDIFKTAYATYLSELSYKLLEHRTPEYDLYHQFVKTIEYINQEEDYQIPVMMYELKLYKRSGFAPVVDHCVNCQKQKSHYYFSVQEGGIICEDCSTFDSHIIEIPQVFTKFLPIFLNQGLEQIGKISVKEDNIKLLRFILDQYYEKYGGFNIKSKRFINQMSQFKNDLMDK